MDEERTRASAKHLNLAIKPGKWLVCAHCAEAKAKKKSISKVIDGKPAEKANEQVCLDISTVRKPSRIDGNTTSVSQNI